MSTDPRTLILKLTALRDLLRKNCGVGSGGFQPGNTCGRTGAGNSSEGSERRRDKGEKRKRKGPTSGVGDRSRAARRKFDHEAKGGKFGQDGRILRREQAKERKDHADMLRAERKEQRSDDHASRRDLRKEITAERKEQAKDRSKDRKELKRSQAKEAAKLTKTQEKQSAKLDASYEAAKAKTANPERLEASYKEKKEALAADHAEQRDDLSAEHKQARREMIEYHRSDRNDEREGHRDQINSNRDDERGARNEQHMSHRESTYELHETHRAERADLKRDYREGQQDDEKAFAWVDVKAARGEEIASSGVPTSDEILTDALIATGHAAAWEAGTLEGKSLLDALHAVRLEARLWLRSEAQSVLDDLDEPSPKALFGKTKARLGFFFDRAKKYVREIVAAGLLVIAGPGPVTQQEAIASSYEEQVKIQAEYLADFRKQIIAGDKPLDGTFVARAEQYGNAAWSAPQAVVRAASIKNEIFDYEMREHFGKDKPCKTCREQVDLKWQKIGTLKAIGDSECMSGCHCSYLFKKGLNGTPHVAGRGPLWEPAFGRTG